MLTKSRLEAIIEALNGALEGNLEGKRQHYEGALEWANAFMAKTYFIKEETNV